MTIRSQLITLHRIDLQLRHIEAMLSEGKSATVREKHAADALRDDILRIEQQLKRLRTKTDTHDRELARIDRLVVERRGRMSGADGEKEREVRSKEIEWLKAERHDLAETAAADLSALQELEADLHRLTAVLRARRQREMEAESGWATLRAEHEGRLEWLSNERERIIARIPPETLALYDRLVESCDGQPLAPLREADSDSGQLLCDACSIPLPPEQADRVLKTAELVQCPGCHRLLHIEGSVRRASSPPEAAP